MDDSGIPAFWTLISNDVGVLDAHVCIYGLCRHSGHSSAMWKSRMPICASMDHSGIPDTQEADVGVPDAHVCIYGLCGHSTHMSQPPRPRKRPTVRSRTLGQHDKLGGHGQTVGGLWSDGTTVTVGWLDSILVGQ